MSPQDTLRRAILNDEFPDDPDMDRLFTPVGEDLLKLNRNIALSAWMSQVSKSDINAGSPTWQADKDALVQGYFKNPTASNVSDEQLHSLVKTHIQTSEEAADMAANMALQGKTSFEALKELNTKRGPSLVRPIWDNYTKDLVQRHSVLSQKLAPYRGIVDSAASKLSKEMEWSLPTTQKFQEVATQLLQVPEEDRHLVISAIGATGGATAEERASYLSKLAGAMGRMTETLGASVATDVENASLAETVISLQEAGQMDFARKMEKNIQGRQEINFLAQQIRQVADSEISPIKGDNWWSQTGIDVARMAPQVAVTVANPMLGTAANLSYFRNTVAAEAKQEDPSLTYQQADTIGALTAPFNAAIETVTALIPFGKVKLPFVQKWLSTTTTSVKGAARNLVIRGAFGVASEVGEEMAQAVAPLWTQELLGALSKDMSGVDWEKRMPDFSKIAAQTWGPALVFALVGGGGASINDIKNGRALASDRDTMVATGMAPAMADQIATAAEAGDWSKADSLFRQEFVSTTKATDEEKTAAVARIMEAQKAQDVFRSSSERGADELERAQTIEKAIESLSQVRVFRDAEGWAVEDTSTNEVVRVGSREEASNLAYSRFDDNAREEAQSMAKVFEAYSSGGDILELDLGKSMDLSETGDTESAMKEAAMTEAMLNGMTREQAEKVTWTVLGSNRLETVEGVRRAVSRLFSGASVMDAIEEPVEARFQAGLEQGVFTSDEALNFVKIAADVMKAPELVTTAESSPRGLTEAISDIVMADTFGQRKDGRKGVAGAVTAGLKARLRRQAELSGAESKFAAFLAAFRRFFKQVFQRSRALLKARKEGKLTGDFDEFLDTLMNVDPQRRHDAAAAKEALEIAQAGNMAFSLGRAVPADASNVTEMPDGAQLVGPTSFSLKAYHGTPHKVDKLTTAKIGTGEGAQAYGWGLYFAEARAIAEYYQKALTDNTLYFNGKPLLKNGVMIGSLGDAELDDWFYHGSESYDPEESAQSAESDGRPDIAAKIRALIPNITKGEPGNLYTVELLPDADEFLDWDKPLSEQSEKVKAVLQPYLSDLLQDVEKRRQLAIQKTPNTFAKMPWEASDKMPQTGRLLYDQLAKNGIKAASEKLASLGIPGIRYLDGGSRGAGDGTRNYVIFDESLVRILEENGKPVSGASFSLAPRSLPDAEFDQLSEKEQDAVLRSDDVANARSVLHRGMSLPKNDQYTHLTFDDEPSKSSKSDSLYYFVKAWLTDNETSRLFKKDDDGFLEYDYQLEEAGYQIDDDGVYKGLEIRISDHPSTSSARTDADIDLIVDDSRASRPSWYQKHPDAYRSFSAAAFDIPKRVAEKLRIQAESPSFSLAPRSLPEVADTILAAQMKKPAFFEAFVTLARRKMDKLRKDGDWRVDKRGIASKRVGFDSRMAGVRSADNIENERKFRLRSRQRELIDEGMLALAPETLAAYDAGVASLEDVPIVSDMLGKVGKIMSKSAAQKAGKLKTDGVGSAGDYDGAPRLPPAWYAKSGGSMPYEIAQQLSDMGHLKDGYADTLWDALRSAIYSTKSANEGFKKARDAVRKVETDALAQAKKETDTWAKVETAKIPTEKERQMMALRTLDAILSAFPPEIRAKVGGFVKLASFSTDAAREKEITRRLAKLEEVIEEEAKKHYTAKVEKLFKRFAPKKETGKKATGQLDPDAQELVDAARAAMGYDDTRTRAELAAIDSMLAEDGLTAEREIQLERQRELVQLFGDFDNAESTRMESAADALEDTATEGWAKWKLKKIMERERRTEARQALIADTGKPSIGKERDKQNKWAKTKFGKAFSALLNVSSFSELLRFEFGEKSATARKLEDQERAAAYAYEDAMQAFGDRVGDFFADLAGGRLAGEQLRFDLAQPTLTVGTGDNERTISQLQGIQALLMWQQEDGRRHMEGSFDENGKPSGKWHYGEEWIADLESKLSPEAYQVKSFLEGLYGEEYQPLNAVYRQRHGVNLPKNERYSPITVQPMQAKAGEMVDPVSGFAVTGSILTPGGLRTRNKRAVAEPRFDDAVQIFLGHSRQMEHWKAYYDFATEAQAILLNREVTNAVEAKGSTQAVTVLKKWVDQFAQGGSRDAQAGLEVSSVYSRASGRAARVALLGRISTLLIQSGQLAAASVKMPLGSYLKRLGMLLSGNLDYTDAIKSPFMQRRYKTAPPIVQQALAGVGDIKRPNVLSSTTPRILGNLLSGADALFTGGTYAIILDYHRSVTGPAMGLQGAELEAFAQAEAERDTEAVAQPVRPGTRSVFENSLPIWGKTGFAFASEARQKFTLAAWAAYNAKKDPAQAAKVAFLTFIVGGLVTQVLKNLWREAKDDDDEKMWSAERLVKATIAGPLHGVPGVSELMGDPGLFSGFKWSSEAVKKIATKAMDDDLDEVTMRDVENALSAAGYFNDTAAGIAGLSHLGFDFAKILQALAEEE